MVCQASHRNTLALPSLLTLKVQKMVESELEMTLIPRQCSATVAQPAQPHALLWGWGGLCPFLETPALGEVGVQWRGMMNWHLEVMVLGLGTKWLCNHVLESPGHPASSERVVIQLTQVEHFPTSC